MLFIGRLEQDNSKYRRQGVIDVLMNRERDMEYYKNQPNAWDPNEGELKGISTRVGNYYGSRKVRSCTDESGRLNQQLSNSQGDGWSLRI